MRKNSACQRISNVAKTAGLDVAIVIKSQTNIGMSSFSKSLGVSVADARISFELSELTPIFI
jgi:hypothetical protein